MVLSLRRLAAVVTGLALGTATAVTLPEPAQAAACDTTAQITVLSFNDFHGRIAASSPDTVQFAGTIEEQRAQAGEANTLVVSAGDSIGASLFASFIDGDRPATDLLKALQVDASAVGNHEFDGGFARLRDEVIPRGGFPYLAANVYTAGTQTPVLPAYAITTKAGLKVAVVGAVTRDTPAMVSPDGVAGLDFGDPVAAVNRTIAQLKDGDQANGEADVIIAAYHDGAPGSGSLEENLKASAVFAAMVNQTDRRAAAVLNGHTHQVYAYQAPVSGGGTRPVLQSGSYAAKLGRTVLTVDARTGHGCSATTANLDPTTTPVDSLVATYPRVAAAKQVVTAALEHATQVGSQPIGTASAAITRSRASGNDRGYESAASNAVAQMFFDTLSAGNPAFIGIQNPGGTRADIDAGEVTYAEAAAVLPFANTLMTTKITGAQLKTVLEQQWQRDHSGVPLTTGRQFLRLGLSKNVSYTYDESRPLDQRITSIMVNGAPVDPAATYTVGSGSFLITGGDNFWELAKGTERTDTGKADLESWVAWVKARSPLAPDFSLRGVSVSPHPTRISQQQPVTVAVGAPQGPLALDSLDQTSAGAQPSTTLTARIGQVEVGKATVSRGRASLTIQVPDSVPHGPALLVLTADPAQTTVTLPITVADPTPGAFTATDPTRILDTRDGLGHSRVVSPGEEITVPVAGRGPVPAASVGAVQLTLTVTEPAARGWVAAYPSDATTPNLSTVSFDAGEVVPNLATVRLGPDGKIKIRNGSPGTVHLVADVAGWFAAGTVSDAGMTVTGAPTRILDTRADHRQGLAPDSTSTLRVVGSGQVPDQASVAAVLVNLTVTEPTADGYLTAAADGSSPVSTLSFTAGRTVSNAAVVPVAADGTITVRHASPGTSHLVVDLTGYVTGGQATKPGSYVALAPKRVLDTREQRPVAPGGEVTVPPTAAALPAGASSAVTNVTVVGPQAAGYLSAYPTGTSRTSSSISNFVPGQVVAHGATVRLGQGTFTVVNGSAGRTDVAVDLFGYYLG